jgi:hypothetical protein
VQWPVPRAIHTADAERKSKDAISWQGVHEEKQTDAASQEAVSTMGGTEKCLNLNG